MAFLIGHYCIEPLWGEGNRKKKLEELKGEWDSLIEEIREESEIKLIREQSLEEILSIQARRRLKI
jgi:hypothetical protein